MNMHSQNGDNSSPLKEDLENISRAYGQLDQDEPPELLDQAIMNRAQRAVESKPHWLQFGWLHGLTTTAVFVLAFFIIMNQREPVPVEEEELFERQYSPMQATEPTRKTYELKTSERRSDVKKQIGSADENMESAGFMQKEVLLKTAPMAEAVEPADTPAAQSPAVAAAELARNELEDRARLVSESETDPEMKLLEIIRLKQAGDESWRKELEVFLEQYPDYPLPDVLKN